MAKMHSDMQRMISFFIKGNCKIQFIILP